MKNDPVCSMEVREDSQYTTLHGGKKMFFCSRDCQQKFIRNPDEFMGTKSGKTESEKKGGRRAA